ncbi:MAG: HEAT repeat domain-containing protein [Planctomycetes bacterium]|nr:HEAT repeat domain-containing protein [Planctomycetota bacterium]
MPRALLTAAFGLLVLAPPVRADWLDLVAGTTLRGIDYREGRAGKKAVFTLETGETVAIEPGRIAAFRPSPPGETVEHRGKQVALREKVRALAAERRKREAAAERDLEAWALGTIVSPEEKKLADAARAARERFEALPAAERERALVRAVARSSRKSVRTLAARELASFKGTTPLEALARATVRDREKAVREAAMASIASIGDPAAGERFAPFLKSPERVERVRASRGLETYPARRAVPVLIETLRKVWADFGRGYFFQGTERSYVSDYSLVSGGTGFSLVEVADPTISKLADGVVLDVDVRRVEMEAHVRALRKITGQDFGADVVRWREWWKASEAAAPEAR